MTFYRIENESVMNTEKNDPYLTTKIVRSYVRHHTVRPEQISDLITSVHQALGQLGQLPLPEEVRTPAVSVRRSVHRDYVICLDCGYRGKTLRRHIGTRHGLGRDEYLQRWGLRSEHPLTAPAYSERRSALAKSLGLGRKSTAQATPAVLPPAATPVDVDQGSEATPTRRRRSRSVSKSADVVNEAAASPAPARKSRSRSRVRSPRPEQISSPTVPS
jgi:MucR family transcriptional regulator, transcriptional regulator of exopolysaccharide biosynthesis